MIYHDMTVFSDFTSEEVTRSFLDQVFGLECFTGNHSVTDAFYEHTFQSSLPTNDNGDTNYSQAQDEACTHWMKSTVSASEIVLAMNDLHQKFTQLGGRLETMYVPYVTASFKFNINIAAAVSKVEKEASMLIMFEEINEFLETHRYCSGSIFLPDGGSIEESLERAFLLSREKVLGIALMIEALWHKDCFQAFEFDQAKRLQQISMDSLSTSRGAETIIEAIGHFLKALPDQEKVEGCQEFKNVRLLEVGQNDLNPLIQSKEQWLRFQGAKMCPIKVFMLQRFSDFLENSIVGKTWNAAIYSLLFPNATPIRRDLDQGTVTKIATKTKIFASDVMVDKFGDDGESKIFPSVTSECDPVSVGDYLIVCDP